METSIAQRVYRPGTCMILTLVLLLAGTPSAAAPPSTMPADDLVRVRAVISRLIEAVEAKKARAVGELKQSNQRLDEFKRNNPRLQQDPAIDENLRAIAQALVKAQLDVINARGRYAEGHPVLAAARAREAELFDAYERVMREHAEHDALRAESSKLEADAAAKQRVVDRLDWQLDQLQLLAAVIDEFERPPSTQPADVHR